MAAVYKNSWNDKWTASIELPYVGCRIKEAGSEQEAWELAQKMEAEEAALKFQTDALSIRVSLLRDNYDALDTLVQNWAGDAIGFGKKLDALEQRLAELEVARVGNAVMFKTLISDNANLAKRVENIERADWALHMDADGEWEAGHGLADEPKRGNNS